MMKTNDTLSTKITKTIGSIMTLAFSLMAFAYGQSCTLLPGFTPNTLVNGVSRTAYQIPEATFTQSCEDAQGSIFCDNGTVTNGNIYKYPSCITHTWTGCAIPVVANHLEHKTLYKAGTANYTQNCNQLSQSLQCLNGAFTGGTTPSLYTFGSCTDTNRSQCVDIWTTSYKDHGETVVGYLSATPTIGQTCTSLQKTLTCINGTRSGGTQNPLVTGCTNPSPIASCIHPRTNISLPHNTVIDAYTSPSGICSSLRYPLTCINGARSGYNSSLFSGCVATPTIISGSCFDPHTHQHISPFGHVYRYTSNQPSPTANCNNLRKTLTCINGSRTGGSITMSPTCGNCILPRGTILSEGSTTVGYSARLRENTGVNYIGLCSPFSGQLICTNSILQGVAAGGAYPVNNYKYTLSQCMSDFLPKGCNNWAGGPLNHGESRTGYSQTGSELPKTCNQNYAESLTCINGIINGNRQTYKYANCLGETLFPGIDISIQDSQGIAGQEDLPTQIIAQGSSPELHILFKNRGDTPISRSITEKFLTCKREQKNLVVYTSKNITAFSIPVGGKINQVIRIQPLFTQAEGTKKLICEIHPLLLGSNGDTSNDIRSGQFEIVKANRFDLALNRSIESINKNLEAAEGAIGADGLRNFLFDKIMNVLVPLIIIVGILSAILGFYKLMFSSDENAVKEGTNYIIYGVIGIIVIMSAKFIGQNIYDIITVDGGIEGYKIATSLYDKILYPFIKLAIYLVLGAMFVILLGRVITFLFGSDTDAQKKAGTLIGRNIISMLIIIGSKQIVEVIYGARDKVVNENMTNLGEIGSGVLENKSIPILYDIINYALGIASLVILVIIIVQTLKLLMKPDDPAQAKSIKTSLMYMFIGILILGAGYLIVNFAIIN